MHRFSTRLTAFVGLTGIAVALAGVGIPAQAATTTNGVGTTTVTSKLVDLNVAAGLLHLSVFTDQGSANTDSKSGPASARNALTPLTVTSSLTDLSAINSALAAVTAPVSAQSPPDQSVNKSVVDFSKTPVAPVLSGKLQPIDLATALDSVKGATSGLTAALTNLQVLSGVAGITTLANQDALSSAPSAATASRQFNLGDVPLLNLGALLQGLGIDPSKLPVSAVTSLVDQLKLPVPSLGGTSTTLSTATSTLLGLISLNSAAAGAQSQSTQIPVSGALAPVINTLDSNAKLAPSGQNVQAGDLQTILASIEKSLNITSFTDLLSTLLGDGLSSLLKTPLLEVNTGALQVVTKAADTIANSAATVSAGNPVVKALGVSVPGIDTLISTLQTALGTINKNLAGLLSVSLLDQSHNVSQANGYVNAVAQASELKLTIDPSKIGLSSIISSLPGISQVTPSSTLDLGKTAIGSLVQGLKLPANPFASLVNAKILDTGAPLALGATTLSLGQVTSQSNFTVVPAAAVPAQPQHTMPLTGRELGPWAAMAAVLLALSLGARRWLGRARATS